MKRKRWGGGLGALSGTLEDLDDGTEYEEVIVDNNALLHQQLQQQYDVPAAVHKYSYNNERDYVNMDVVVSRQNSGNLDSR